MSSLGLDNSPLPRFSLATQPRLIIALMWLFCCAAMLLLYRNDLVPLHFQDPDDPMRFAQVRDWIAGQSWFDVSQHRVNPPLGGPMHWSRIVDLPIAMLILAFRPLVGTAHAEILACIATPLLLLGGLTVALYIAARRIVGQNMAVLSVLLLLTAPSILIQFTPLRIDHHDWQIVMAAIAMAGLFDPRAVRGGVTTAGALAIWLQISSESLPYVALFAGTLGLYQWIRQTEAVRFVAFAATLGGAALVLLVATRGWSSLVTTHCDALSAAYIWPLATFAMITPIAWHLIGTRSHTHRFLIAAIGGGVAIVTLACVGGPCLSGDPFQAMGPVAYKLWYLQIMEGLPVWKQDLARGGTILLPPIIGLLGTAIAAWQSRHDRLACERWLLVALLLTGATAVAVMVMRALSVAHVFALPSTAWLIWTLFHRAQASGRAFIRVIGSTALVLLSPTGICALWIGITSGPEVAARPATTAQFSQCAPGAPMTELLHLPPSLLFAPLDIGPTILIRTRHDIVATGHHRNAIGITAVVEGFTASPDKARSMIARLNGGKGVDYVVTCTSLNEFKKYVLAAPHGLAAALNRGRVPGWLKPLPGGGVLKVYKVVDQPGANAIATPFMQ